MGVKVLQVSTKRRKERGLIEVSLSRDDAVSDMIKEFS